MPGPIHFVGRLNYTETRDHSKKIAQLRAMRNFRSNNIAPTKFSVGNARAGRCAEVFSLIFFMNFCFGKGFAPAFLEK